MKIVVVEDDHLQADWIRKKLEQGPVSAEIITIKTESEFCSRLDEIAKEQPAVIVMDVMLRWADPEPGMHLPDDEQLRRRFRRAGLRCARLLETREDTKRIPVVLYTVLEKNDLSNDLGTAPSTVVHLEKDSHIEPLVEMIRQLTHRHTGT